MGCQVKLVKAKQLLDVMYIRRLNEVSNTSQLFNIIILILKFNIHNYSSDYLMRNCHQLVSLYYCCFIRLVNIFIISIVE